MCRRILLILWTLTATVGTYVLRTGQLPVSADICRIAFWSLPLITIVVSFLLSIPETGGSKLSELRSVSLGIALLGSGALLITASAVWQLYLLYPVFRSFSAITAAVLLLGGLGLFGGMAACCKQESKAGSLLLLPLSAAALQLVAAYWNTSTDPNWGRYAVQILFLASTAISMGLLTDFVFADGKRRLTLVFLSLTLTLSGALLPSANSLPDLFAIVGTAFTALGYLFILQFGFEEDTDITYELVEDPFSTGRVRPSPAATEADGFAEASPDKEFAPAPRFIDEASAAENDAFDLSRVDRLLLELELEDEGKQAK